MDAKEEQAQKAGLYVFAKENYKSGTLKPDEIIQQAINAGMKAEVATVIVKRVVKLAKTENRNLSWTLIAAGILLIFCGVMVTIFSYNMAAMGDRFMVALGMPIAGIAFLGKGIPQLFKYS